MANPEPADAIVVLGCRVYADGTPSPALIRRLVRAVAVAGESPHAVVVVTGGDCHGHCEAEVMAARLAASGIAPARIREERRAKSTAENARFVAPVLVALGARRVVVVTDAFHMRRSLALLKRALHGEGARGLALVAAPAKSDKPWWERWLLAVEESGKLFWDLWRPGAR